MMIATTPQKALELTKGKSIYIETEKCYWIQTEKGEITKVLKPLPHEYIKQKLLDGGFPESYVEELKNAKKTKTLEQILKAPEDRGLVVSGKAGIGKTFSLIFKIAKLLKYYKIHSPLYLTLQDFQVRKELFEEKRLSQYDLILLDDVNPNLNQLEKKFVLSVIFHVNNNNHKKKLYITTNVNQKELLKFLEEEPAVSRVLGMCEYLKINENKDLRLTRR